MPDSRLDELVKHRIGLERYQTSILHQVLPVLHDAEQDIVQIIHEKLFDPRLTLSEARRLETTLRTVRKALLETYEVIFKRLWREYRGLSAHEADWAHSYYRDLFAVQHSISVPSASTIVAAALERPMSGRHLKAWADKMTAEQIAEVERQIRLGVIEGESIDQMVRRLRGTEAFRYRDGLGARQRRSLEALVRTSVNHISNAAHLSFLQQNPEVFQKVQFVAVLDNRTTPRCRSLSGQVFDIDKAPVPPLHVNCRSTLVGLPTAPDGTQATEPLADVSYEEWLREQPVEVQEDVLGVAKAKLFRVGELRLDRFVDHTGKELTLDQLKRQERAAWERTFLTAEDRRALSVTRRLNSLVSRASDDMRPLAETAQRAWQFLRFHSSQWLEAAAAQWSRPVDPELVWLVFMLDFFDGPATVQLFRSSAFWRSIIRRGLRSRPALVYPHARMPRGLIVHPSVRRVRGEILPPAGRSRTPVPVGPRRRPGDGVIIDIDPTRPPQPPTPRPIVPPRQPGSIIVPPDRRGPATRRPPADAPTPPPRAPVPTERLPHVMRVLPDKDGEAIIPKIADDVKSLPPPSPVRVLPSPQPGQVPAKVPALTNNLPAPKNPLRITVPELERELDRLLPREGTRFDADDALRSLWNAFRQRGHDGLEILDGAGTPRLRIGLNEQQLSDFLGRWRAARGAFDDAQRPLLPAPPRHPALTGPSRIADRADVRPGVQTPDVIHLPHRPPPAPIPPHGVPGDLAAVAKTQLGNAARGIDDLARPSARRRVPLAPRIAARRAREAEARRLLAEQQIRDLLADLNEINAGLEGLRPISRQHQMRADMLQRLTVQNKLESDVTIYRPIRWADYAERLGPSPARLDKLVIESPSFISGTGNEITAFEAGAKFGNGPLVVMRMNLKAGDAALAGNRQAHELVLPAGARLKVNAVRRMRARDIPADLRKLYPDNQEFWLADADLVRAGDPIDRAITAARTTQERYIDRLSRMQLDNEAERAMRHTPYAPFRQVSEGVDEWPVYDASTGEMLIGPPKAHPVIILGGERRVIDPRDAGSAPLYRRALGTMINRAGRVQPLTDEIAKEAQDIGDRFIKGFSLQRFLRRMDAGNIARADRFLPEPRASIVRKVRDLIDVDMEQFGDAAGPLGHALLKKDPVAFARMVSQLSNANMRGYFLDRGYDATRAAQEGAELQRGARMFAELVDGITKGKARVKFYDLSNLDGSLRTYRGKEHLAQAFEAWFALQYSPNPTWRRAIEHMMPDLDDAMRKVLQARSREAFPDVWAPTLRVTQNRRIVADPRSIDVDRLVIEGPPASIAAGIRESVRQRFYDYLEGNGSIAKRVHNQIAKDLGVSRQDVEVLIREAQRAGWVRAQGKGFRVVPADKRPPRPIGEPAISPTQHQRDLFYDYLEGKSGGSEKSLGSLSQAAMRDLQREIGATPLQMSRLTFEAQDLGWISRDARGQLRRTWTRGLQRTDKAPPPRPKPQDIERIEGTLGTPAGKIDPAEAPRRRRGDDDDFRGTGGSGAGPVGPGPQGGGLSGPGGLRGSPGELGENVWASAEDPPLRDLPAQVTVPGRGRVTFGPLKRARQAAIDYMRDAGLPYNPPRTYAKVDVSRAQRIAKAYEAMPHNPNDPEVQAAFKAMIDETLAQYQYIKRTGLKIDLMDFDKPDPYAASPRLAHLDVIENNHLWVYPTDAGFGSNADFDVSDNPLMQFTDEYLNGRRLRANDVFRIVHDYFGHFKEGVGFRADGEENAWRAHSAMYSPLARRAMTTETRGQNSWVNFGPHGEKNRTAKAEDTIFADQKTGLLPQWVVDEGAGDLPDATAPPVTTRRVMQPADTKELVERIVSEMKGIPLDKTAHARLPVRTESEETLVKEVWRHATLTPEIEKAISGAESITISEPTDGPTYYDPVTGTLQIGRRDASKLKDRVWFRHEYAHHLDLPMTPDGTVVQYSAAPEFGLAKAMQADLERLAESYVPDAKLTMSADDALARFRTIYGIDLSSLPDKAMAHRMAERALTGNAAFLKLVDQAVRSGAIPDAKLASEFMVYSDLTAAATKLRLGTGHPEAYFAGGFDIGEGYTSRHANEAFANWFALHSSDVTGWRILMQQYFPRVVETNASILDRIGADAHGEQ